MFTVPDSLRRNGKLNLAICSLRPATHDHARSFGVLKTDESLVLPTEMRAVK
ncbi:hypothetical protein GRAN_5203 [Granulicella sibirica]|uniref:Uncharacterized protein n=1 Tax=Granulicella sibirica TaxID=2479048 RepID=A0A4Q0SSH3_9BACT|nr:hypothetical protein GRAN_5203 [Granulicella sibirica]